MNTKSKERRTRSALGVGLLALAIGAPMPFVGDDDDRVADVRDVHEQWVEVQRILSKEKADWAVGEELLTSRIEVLDDEVEALEAKIAEANKSVEDTQARQQKLEAEKAKLDASTKVLEDAIAPLETRLKALLVRLPEPLRARVKPLSQGIPEDPAKTELPLVKRYANVIVILNEVDKFNREISVTSEVRRLDDETSAEVTALYIGIGQAYYVTAKRDAAGVGSASETGWTWTKNDGAAEAIAKAIAVFKDEQAAAFAPLPIEIK